MQQLITNIRAEFVRTFATSTDKRSTDEFNMKRQLRHRISALLVAAALGGAALTLASIDARAQDATTTPPATEAAPAPAPGAVDPATGLPAATPDAAAPAEAAPAADAAAAPAAGGTEHKESPYSLQHLWKTGNIVSRSTMVLLVIMSVGTWYILFNKYFEQARLFKHANTANKSFWSADSIEAGAGKLEKTSAFRAIVDDGMNAVRHHEGKLTDQIDLNEWVTMSLQRSTEAVNNRLQSGMAFLATVGSTAPFVGLFGTVWGILQALISIGVSGQASIDKVAGPVGEALIMTAIGLGVAVPAVIAYNWLLRRNKLANDRVRAFAADLHSVLLAGSKPKGRV